MKGTFFESGMRVIRQVLDWMQLSKDSSITERWSDAYLDGVLSAQFNNMAIIGKDLDASLTDFFHVKIDTGVAYKNGERIFINPANITFNSSNPSHTTDDGLGNPIPTPRSTGSFNIPVTASAQNYIWIAYLQTIDDSVFTLQKVTNAKQFYKRTDGYEIVVTTVNTNPDSARFIFIGRVNCSGTNTAISSNIFINERNQGRLKTRRVAIETNNNLRTDRPAAYTDNQGIYFLDDHIKSVGTGLVTPFNPHGTSLEDLGVSSNQTVERHRTLEHANGIISPTIFPPASGLACIRVVVSPGNDFITVKALTSAEVAIVNGVGYGSSLIPTDVNISFVSSPSGTYNVYFDSVTQTFDKTTASIATDTTKLWLCTTTWDDSIPGDGNLTPPTERRRFGTTNRLQMWTSSSRPPSPLAGFFGYNLDLNKLEYFNGSLWIALP